MTNGQRLMQKTSDSPTRTAIKRTPLTVVKNLKRYSHPMEDVCWLRSRLKNAHPVVDRGSAGLCWVGQGKYAARVDSAARSLPLHHGGSGPSVHGFTVTVHELLPRAFFRVRVQGVHVLYRYALDAARVLDLPENMVTDFPLAFLDHALRDAGTVATEL